MQNRAVFNCDDTIVNVVESGREFSLGKARAFPAFRLIAWWTRVIVKFSFVTFVDGYLIIVCTFYYLFD